MVFSNFSLECFPRLEEDVHTKTHLDSVPVSADRAYFRFFSRCWDSGQTLTFRGSRLAPAIIGIVSGGREELQASRILRRPKAGRRIGALSGQCCRAGKLRDGSSDFEKEIGLMQNDDFVSESF